MTDVQLALRLKNGEAQAITAIYERFKRGLFLFCLRLLNDSAAAEDVVHETFVRMIAEHEALREPGSLKSWMFTIARNESFAVLRLKKKYREIDDHDENMYVDDTTETNLELLEQKLLLENLLNRLLPQYKEVLMLREYEGMNYQEIADITGTSVSAVKSKLFKARKSLMDKSETVRKAEIL